MTAPAARPPLLVLGARSLVGGFLLARLAAHGRPWLAVSRRGAPSDAAEPHRWVAGDLADAAAWAEAWSGREAVSLAPLWTLAAALPALHARGLRRLVAFSSTSRFTKSQSPEPAEREVASRLAEAEAEVEARCAALGVAWTILRPTLIYAEGLDGNVSRLAGLIRRLGVLPLAGAGGGLRQPVHADDLAAAALAALDAPAAEDRAYDLPGGETLSYRAMAARVFEGMGRGPRILPVPAPLWTLGFALARPWLKGATAAMGRRMEADLVFDGAAARRDLSYTPRPFHPRFPP